MNGEPNIPVTTVERRHFAEVRLNAGYPPAAPPATEVDARRLLHELQVHQVELEMQNVELKEARERMETLLEKYTDLYDFSPVGYFTLAATGTIQMVNLTGARLISTERSRLVGQPFGLLVAAKLRPVFAAFLKRVFTDQVKEAGEFELVRSGWPSRIVNIEAQCSPNGRECSLVVVDITERKEVELGLHRLDVLTASNRKLELEIVRRQAVEQSLKHSEQHQRRLLAESRQMQAQLRHLSHQILHAQEEERKRISRELHDEIAQALVGINVGLADLTQEASGNSKRLRQKIARAQRLVEKSVDTVHRFARELRPTVLDDLGLIPALHTFMKEFTKRTGVRAQLTAFAALEKLDIAKRTILYRVAHEALNNVARHAQASRVEVSIEKLRGCVCLKIKDDGKSFDAERTLQANRGRRLGLLGMRERLEMVGGSFAIESAPGQGTVIQARIPLDKRAGRKTS